MTSSHNYGLITSLDELDTLIAACYRAVEQGGAIGFDIETGYYGPDREKGAVDDAWGDQFIVGFSVAPNEKVARYVAVGHDDVSGNLDSHEAWKRMKPLLEDCPIVAHNARFEAKNLRRLAEKEQGPRIDLNMSLDSMLEAYVLSEYQAAGLKPLVLTMFGHQMTNIKDLFPDATAKQLRALRFNTLELTPKVVEYACEDAAWCLAIHNAIGERAKKERKLMFDLEHRISEIMVDVEEHGVMVDWDALIEQRDLAEGFSARMDLAVKEGLGAVADRDLRLMNLNSPAQIKKLLYDELGWKTTRLTASGQDAEKAEGKAAWELMSTDSIALEALSREHDAVKQLLQYREVQNLRKRLEKWPQDYKRWSPDLRVRPNFQQTVVGSGRFAASDPAIQQLPKKWFWATDPNQGAPGDDQRNGIEYWKGNFRDFIIAGEGNYLLTFDYSQIELRVMAGVSQEPGLLEAFDKDEDVHTLTAAMMLNKEPWEVDREKERPLGKTMNFALLYGMGMKKLAESLAVSQDRAQELYDNYFKNFPSITAWMTRMKTAGVRQGYVESAFGRKTTLWELQHPSKAIRSKGERLCVNVPIQGGAADYMKIAMLRAVKALKARNWWLNGCTIIMNQHDSLTFEVSNKIDPNELRTILQEAVVFPHANFPKIVADWELGQKWGSSPGWGDEKAVWDGEHWVLSTEGLEEFAEEALTWAKETAPMAAELFEKADEDLTEDDVEALQDAAEPVEIVGPPPVAPEPVESAQDDSEALEIVVELKEMPVASNVQAFMTFVREHPGNNTVRLMVPSGDSVTLSVTTSLDLKDKGSISYYLGGAETYYETESVKADELLEGILL